MLIRQALAILLFFALAGISAQNPHGADLRMDCAACHTSDGWAIAQSHWKKVDPDKSWISKTTGAVWQYDSLPFHHNSTNFALQGQHQNVDCRSCHSNLIFSEANSDCISCHTDIHQQSVGTDCARCHNSSNWFVNDITGLHQTNGFPLTGVHKSLDCAQCHQAASALQFEPQGNRCIDCHQGDFNAATNPNHQQAGFSTDCLECHDLNTAGWGTDKVKHDFFPLTKGHAISDCAQCHTGGNYANTPTNCFECHASDYQAAASPSHVLGNFSNDCASCHTTDPDWMPAQYTQHDAAYFPIYSGKHQGQWSQCSDCHQNPSNYAEFTCISCHTNPETNNSHSGVNGYVYENSACLACHPTGDGDVSFDHNTTGFPLTGAHLSAECQQCHANGYAGTPAQCAACHQNDYNQAANPNHLALHLTDDCTACHSTAPGWTPADFPVHGDFYPLNGAHQGIADDCAACHHGDYNNTPNTCAGCHIEDFNTTTQPNHQAAHFPQDCAICHSETAWAPSTFDHNAIYPFTGAHLAIADDCNACHQGNYTNTPNTCEGCHSADFNQAINPNHVALNLPQDCASCHTTAPGWEPAAFPIHNNYYPLNGAHAGIAGDCAACHHGDYNHTPNTCAGCHIEDFNASTQPNHQAAQFPQDCAVCHSETAWAPSTFDHNTVYPFTGAHIAIADNCTACHQNGNYTNTPNTCEGCHITDFNQTVNPSHTALNLPTDCAACHTTAPGWEPATFPIHNNYYVLNGAHAAIAGDCATCHHGDYNNTPNTCIGCHQADYNATSDPNHLANQFPVDCASCHSETAWQPSTFDHNSFYPLIGAHAAIAEDCNACHHGDYISTPNTCAGCHTPDYNSTTDPNHLALQFPLDCAVCHSQSSWAPSTFDHNSVYPLIGAHAAIAEDCNACHHGNYTNTPNTCYECHVQDYNQVTDPNHVAAQFPTDCKVCHTETAWTPTTFDHNAIYPFTGAHLAIANDCAACHHGEYVNTPNTCAGCHTPDYNASVNPNHVALAIPMDCAMCHSTEPGWAPATFPIHNNYYALNGAHASIAGDCATCHNGDYNNTPNACAGCHQAEYNAATTPNHQTNQFPTTCQECHSESAWAPSTFDHSSVYPFTGAHVAIADNCTACHQNGNYNNTPNTCEGCHLPAYNTTINPNHVALAIPTDCATCHTTNPGWAPATFPIHNNYYALNGAHSAIAEDCATCHNGDYNNTPNTCVGCHQTDYNAATDPNHQTNQFPTTCQECHSESAWAPSTFDHSTVYPFTGAHVAIADNCTACHQNGNYNNTPNTCEGCHLPAYNASINPNHVALAIPTECATCHSTNPGWEPATFPIHNNYYALNGAHAAIANDCATCHNGDYNNTPNTCVGCHQADYNAATDPNHQTNQFPTNCQECHSESAWAPSTFDHSTVYPFTGAHIAIADNCTACHQNGNYNNTPNTCEGCHLPAYNASINPNHVALAIPTECATCHSTNPGWEPATFPIHNNYYALNGAHAAIANDCATCHNGDYNNTPNTCVGCHQADYNAATDPNHQTNQFPTTCQDCHSETAWAPSTFDHNAVFPFTGAHIAIADNCTACHQNGNYSNTPNTCDGCHMPAYNAGINPNHVALALPIDCAMCHTTNPGWEPATFPIHNNYYALNGAHAAIANDCAACHNGDYNNTPNTCVGCHQADYNAATDPNHQDNQFPTTCQDCHSETAWAPSTFDHNTVYPLTGAHLAIADDCNACHQNGNYSTTPNTCQGCHTPDYNSSINPNHQALGIPMDCAACHTTEPGWEPATFPIHNNYWALNGAHTTVTCVECHNGDYNNTPTNCAGCHQADYNAATDPNHVSNQLPLTCQDCHNESAWIPSTFDHNTVYPFTGAHIPIADDCNACHQGNYSNTPNTCEGCHMPDYNSSLNPKHPQLSIPTDCAMCHTTDPNWEPATFPIHNNYWQLNGAHLTVACVDCHNGNYNNTPNTCAGCHTDDYNATTNPNHSQAGFATTCQDCHTEDAWIPSFWDHSSWALTGAHANAACVACHPNGNYNNTPTTCYGCHATDYNNTNDPDHQSAQFPTTCENCHNTTAWVPATWDHDQQYFPIYSGTHDNEWNQCTDCHTTSGNFALFSCIDCHEHDDPQELADDHQGVSGYQYNSQACYNCHPDGND